MCPESTGSLIVAAPSGSYGTGTPQRPLTIVTVHDDNWMPPLADTVNVGTNLLFNVLPGITHQYRIWFSQITFLIEGYMAAGTGGNVLVEGYGALLALDNPTVATQTDAAYPSLAHEINRATANSTGAASSSYAVQLYAEKSNFCEYPGGLLLPTGWGLSAFTFSTYYESTGSMNSQGSSLITVGYDIP